MTPGFHCQMTLGSEDETARFAARLAPVLRIGDVLLLEGGLGAGKTHFARALIQARLRAAGLYEEVPSPTYTIAQVYDDGGEAIWHCDLYRLTGPEDTDELGLAEAFDQAICLIEWPDRLGPLVPEGALTLRFEMGDAQGTRRLTMVSRDAQWKDRLQDCLPVASHG